MRKSSKWLSDIDIKKNAKDVWAKVREVVRGTGQDHCCQNEGITAQMLNDHYAAISTDSGYCTPVSKLTVKRQIRCITEWEVFQILDRLRPTAT